MTRKFMISRRAFAGAGLASAGLFLGRSALAQPKPLTAESPMGPFFPLSVPGDSDADLTTVKGRSQRAAGEVIQISGRVFNMKGEPIPGARIDLWQANAKGRYDHPSDPAIMPLDPNFQGFASIVSDSSGDWRIVTIKPGSYDSPIGQRPPHIHFDIRGRIHRNIAQMYFPEDSEGNARDSLYQALGAEAATSVAARDSGDPNRYVWNIVLMG